jgi:hypothetical protein
MQQQLSAEAYQLGEIHHLGPLMAIYKTEYTRDDALFSWFMLFFVCLMIAYVCVSIPTIIFSPPTGHIFPWYVLIWPFIFMPSIYNTYLRKKLNRSPITFLQRNLRVYLYHDGLIRINNHRQDILYWEQIKWVKKYDIRTAKKPYTPASVTVVCKDGKKLKFSTIIPGFDQLLATIESAAARYR